MSETFSSEQVTSAIQDHRWLSATEKGACSCNDGNTYSQHDWAIHIAEVLEAQ